MSFEVLIDVRLLSRRYAARANSCRRVVRGLQSRTLKNEEQGVPESSRLSIIHPLEWSAGDIRQVDMAGDRAPVPAELRFDRSREFSLVDAAGV